MSEVDFGFRFLAFVERNLSRLGVQRLQKLRCKIDHSSYLVYCSEFHATGHPSRFLSSVIAEGETRKDRVARDALFDAIIRHHHVPDGERITEIGLDRTPRDTFCGAYR